MTLGGMIVMLCSFRAWASAFANTSSASLPTITVSHPGIRSAHFKTFAIGTSSVADRCECRLRVRGRQDSGRLIHYGECANGKIDGCRPSRTRLRDDLHLQFPHASSDSEIGGGPFGDGCAGA